MKKPRSRAPRPKTVTIDAETLNAMIAAIECYLHNFRELMSVSAVDEHFVSMAALANKRFQAIHDSLVWQTSTRTAKRLKTQGRATQ